MPTRRFAIKATCRWRSSVMACATLALSAHQSGGDGRATVRPVYDDEVMVRHFESVAVDARQIAAGAAPAIVVVFVRLAADGRPIATQALVGPAQLRDVSAKHAERLTFAPTETGRVILVYRFERVEGTCFGSRSSIEINAITTITCAPGGR